MENTGISPRDLAMMRLALAQAREAATVGEVPVGAVVIDAEGTCLAGAGNRCVHTHDPAGHAELIALRQAGLALGNYRLPGVTVYCTLEPCAMCATAMVHARIARLVYGAADPKAGAVNSVYTIGMDTRLNHCFSVTAGVLADECSALLTSFFRARRRGRD